MSLSRFSALSLLLVLPACVSEDDALVQAISCPRNAVLAQASSVTKFRPGAPAAPENATARIAMSPAALECDYDSEDARVEVDLAFAITARPGPAAAGERNFLLPFFVAVLDRDGNVLSKRLLNTEIEFSGAGSSKGVDVDDIAVSIAAERRPFDYQILTGFQLEQSELAYNRSLRNPDQ